MTIELLILAAYAAEEGAPAGLTLVFERVDPGIALAAVAAVDALVADASRLASGLEAHA